ncbi:MAG: GGDEF domain-containing protein, partial [Geminicoccaceae bacterium]
MNVRRRPFGTMLLTLALLLFTASLLFIEQRLERLTDSVADTNSLAGWSLFQTRFELERLLHAIDRTSTGQETELQALRTRFDVFWSRVELLHHGADGAMVRALPGATALLDGLHAMLERHAEAFDRAPDPAEVAALRTDLLSFETPLQDLVLSRSHLNAEESSTLQWRLRELRTAGWMALAGLLASAAILIALLYRENRTTRRLLVRTEESRLRIEHLAHHDALTGLPNRRLFEDRLVQALAVAARARRRLALLYLDLDGFKDINDSLGHRAGDDLLKGVADRLRATVRGGDTIARIGGDEFAVVQVELRTPTDAATLADRLMTA